MWGTSSTTLSPSTTRTMRKTPWVAGCCGPTLMLRSIVSSSCSVIVGSKATSRSACPGFQPAVPRCHHRLGIARALLCPPSEGLHPSVLPEGARWRKRCHCEPSAQRRRGNLALSETRRSGHSSIVSPPPRLLLPLGCRFDLEAGAGRDVAGAAHGRAQHLALPLLQRRQRVVLAQRVVVQHVVRQEEGHQVGMPLEDDAEHVARLALF